jgi:hypothetical protein
LQDDYIVPVSHQIVNRLNNTHDIIGFGQSGKSSSDYMLSRKAASNKVCSPEPEVSFKPTAVCRIAEPFPAVRVATFCFWLDSDMRGCRCSGVMGIAKPID